MPLVFDPAKIDSQRFTNDLDAIAKHANGEKITIAEIETILRGRGIAVLSLILSIPFIQPIPLPGLSIAFGLTFMTLGIQLACGSVGGLPSFVKKRELDAKTLQKIIFKFKKIFSYIEWLFKPRLDFMLRPPFLNGIGISIFISGLALSMPFPPVILFSNSLPAWATIFLCLGYLERDGLVVIVGHLIAIATWCYFAIWWEAVKIGFESLAIYLK